jgi:hypothetical protein
MKLDMLVAPLFGAAIDAGLLSFTTDASRKG